jgi:hypothetical protein
LRPSLEAERAAFCAKLLIDNRQARYPRFYTEESRDIHTWLTSVQQSLEDLLKRMDQ